MTETRASAQTAKQGLRFIGVGLCVTLLDFLIYSGLLLAGLGTAPSKFFAALAGIVASYLGNRFFTFNTVKTGERRIAAFVMLYAVTLLANVAVNELVLSVLPLGAVYRIPGAFIAATAVSAVLNFIGLKFFVFKDRKG